MARQQQLAGKVSGTLLPSGTPQHPGIDVYFARHPAAHRTGEVPVPRVTGSLLQLMEAHFVLSACHAAMAFVHLTESTGLCQ